RLLLKGVVLLRVHGRREERTAADPREVKKEASPGAPPLSPELTAAIEEKPDRPGRELFRLLREDGLLTPAVLSVALAMASLGVMIEALLFRGLLSIGGDPGFLHQRAGAAMAVVVFLIGLLALEIPISSAILRMGRRLEIRLRIAFLSKLPHLGERYFHGRLTSDMAQRAHEIRWLRQLPRLGLDGVHLFFRIVLTAGGVILFAPQSAWIAVLAVFLVVGVSFAAQPVMAEQDLRLRIHLGVLSRFYLDALLGLVPIRAHCARRAMQREHEGLLVEWRRAGMDLLKSGAVVAAVEALAGAGFSIWILFNYLEEGGSAGGVLLLLYWALNLPAL
ncbi:MAG: ABC transporter ATP-binding protein, partial [Desulfobacterales bacterium]|nr:ABC transporter ATP-binding protein [Desulfobacterales bacterium]